MKLIIAEKPSLARNICAGIGKMEKKDGYYRINEIATACGFDDPAYFCRLFKKETGVSPQKFQLKLLTTNKIF